MRMRICGPLRSRERHLVASMLRNVEIKAKVKNVGDIVTKAKKLSNSEGSWIEQDDVFFTVPQGRLKLRTFQVSFVSTSFDFLIFLVTICLMQKLQWTNCYRLMFCFI